MNDGDAARETFLIGTHRVVLIDSITQVRAEDADAVVISGSHGGTSSGRYAAAVRATLYAFNDAGVGKNDAGIAALTDLDMLGVAAVAVSHQTARIGSARETWGGCIGHVNAAAAKRELRPGIELRDAVAMMRP